MKISIHLVLLTLAGAVCGGRALAQPAGTAFTYQGRLMDGANAANGSYDVSARLFDAETGGAQVGPVNCADGVSISDGLVTVSLDFGSVFSSGTTRWLEVSVRADSVAGNCGTGTFTTLSPRQRLSGSPTSVGLRVPFSAIANTPSPLISLVSQGGASALTAVGGTGSRTISAVANGPAGVGVFGQNAAGSTYGGLAYQSWGVFGFSNTQYGVVGDTPDSQGAGIAAFNDATSGDAVAVYGQTSSSNGYAGYFLGRGYFSDNVGINTLNPSVPLQITGGSDLSLAAGGNIVLGQIASANLVMDNNELQARNGGAAASLFINANGGNVGIGTNNAQGFQLAVNGPAAKPNGGSWSTLSDARVKKDVRPLTGALEKLLRLRGVTFEYIDPASINELPGVHTGMVAQEVERVAPEWVTTGPTGLKSVAFSGFEALTVEALRESTQAQDRTRARVEELERENQSLRKRLADVEAAVAAIRASGAGPQ